MCVDDFVGSVVRLFIDCGSSSGPLKLIGYIKSVDANRVTLRRQEFIPRTAELLSSYIMSVTVDSSKYAETIISENRIIACEYISFNAFVREGAFDKSFCNFDEILLSDLKAKISREQYVHRELHYYRKDGFCIEHEKSN